MCNGGTDSELLGVTFHIGSQRVQKHCHITRIHYLFCRLQANIVGEVVTCEPLICHICTPI